VDARPRIVLVGGDGGRSGVPSHIMHLCDVLGETADVTVISDRNRGGYDFAKTLPHIEVEGLATSLNPAAALRAKRGLTEALEQIKPDLVWAHARMSLPLARWATRGDRSRLMVTYHGIPHGMGHGAVKSTVSRAIETVSLAVADRHDVVFLTDEDRQVMAASLVGQRLHLLPNCSWLGDFSLPAGGQNGPRRLVMLTRDSVQKNLDLAARIFAALPLDFELQLYGMGTELPALRDRFTSILGPQTVRRVLFFGDTGDARAVLEGADGLLVTSRYEGLSISMIEAMEMGLPILSTSVGGVGLIRASHPLFGEIGSDLAASAATIDAVTTTYRSDPKAFSQAIHTAWEARFAPQTWAHKVKSLVDTVMQSRP
jgi:glycosyltransferase involved in cell wall biosynthesis